jgi:hypothetical protein
MPFGLRRAHFASIVSQFSSRVKERIGIMPETDRLSCFPAELRIGLDAALALYSMMREKSPGLAGNATEVPVYPRELRLLMEGTEQWMTPSAYSMSAESLACVTELVRKNGISKVLEFGSGISTIVLPKVLSSDDYVYLSIEEDAAYAEQVCLSAASQPACGRVRIVTLPFEPGTHITRGESTFTAVRFAGLEAVTREAFGENGPELILIDGPSGKRKWGRFSALEGVLPCAKPGTVVLLDDSLRYREVQILDEWRRRGWVKVHGIYCVGTGLAVCEVVLS